MKKGLILIAVSGLVIVVLYNIHLWFSPRVTLINNTRISIKHAEIKLPNDNLIFSDIQTGSSLTMYRDVEQRDGVYQYRIVFRTNEEISGECGYITSSQYFTDFQISVNSVAEVACKHQKI